jgi:hypothetical protein
MDEHITGNWPLADMWNMVAKKLSHSHTGMKLRHLIMFLSRGTLVCALVVGADAAAASAPSLQQAPAAPAETVHAPGNTPRL